METSEKIEKKKISKWKIAIIVIILILLIGGSVSLANPTIRAKASALLEKLPWTKDTDTSITYEEQIEKIQGLAEYYLSLEPNEAAEKLYIIKNEDEELYSLIVKSMNEKSTSKTENIIKTVRDMDNRENLLLDLHSDLTEKENNQLKKEIQRFEEQDLLIAVNEIESIMNNPDQSKDVLVEVLNNMDEELVAEILYYTDEEVKDNVLSLFDGNKKSFIENKIFNKATEEFRLIDIAGIYETKELKLAVEEIGNSETYSLEELGVIYSNISLLKSSEILAQADDNFIQKLFPYIRRYNELKGEESITNSISKSIEFTNEYNKKITGLVKVYKDMSPNKAANVVEDMMVNDSTVTSLELDNESTFDISDRSIIVDILSRMDKKSLSNIISNMTTENASLLTQLLAQPKN